jgi:hypothetical protein
MAAQWWKQNPYLSNLYGVGELAATIGGGMLTESGAGLAGLAAWLAGASPEERARIIEEARRQSPYLFEPQTSSGQSMAQGAAYLMSPVAAAGEWLANASEQAGGSPLAMSMARTLPDAALWGLGMPGMLRGGAGLSRASEALTDTIKQNASIPGPAQYRAQSGARPVYGPAEPPAPPPALLPGGNVQPIPEPGPASPLGRWGKQAGALNPDAPNPFYENLGTAIRNRPGAAPLPPEGSQRPFYSVLYDAVDQLPAKGTPQEMLSILKKNGVKQAEIEAFLLPELFSGQWKYDPEARYFTEQDIVDDTSTGALAPEGGAPKFVTKQQIKDFISPSTETNLPGPASVFDVQQWRRGYSESGIQKLLTQDEQAMVEELATAAIDNQKAVSELAQALSPEVDAFRSKYPASFFKRKYDLSQVSGAGGRFPYQQIGMNGFGLAFANEFPDAPLSDGNDIGVIESAFLQLFKDVNDGEDYSRLTYANWVETAEEMGFGKKQISSAEEWFDSLPDERKNFVAAYFDAGIEAEAKLGTYLQEIYDANEKTRNTLKSINRIQDPEYTAPTYGMTQLLEGPPVSHSTKPGALEVPKTSLETGLLIPSDWSNTVSPESYHNFPAGTVVFNRTTQRPLHLRSDPSVLSENSARLAEQVQSDINQRALKKMQTGLLTPAGEPEKAPIGYLMGRVPKRFFSQDQVLPVKRMAGRSPSMYREPNAQPRPLVDQPVRLPFSDTGQWSRLGIAQVFADAIEAGDDAVSISSPAQHMLAHPGQYIGSMANDRNILYIPNLKGFSQNQMALEIFEGSAPKQLLEGAKEWDMDGLTDYVKDFIIQNTSKEKAGAPLWLREDIDRLNKMVSDEENTPAFGEAAERQQANIARHKRAISDLERLGSTYSKYSAGPKLLLALDASFLRGVPEVNRFVAELTNGAFSSVDFDYTAGDVAQRVAYSIANKNGASLTKSEDLWALKLLGMDSNLVSLGAGQLYPAPDSAAAGLSTFYGKNLKSTLAKFAKEIDPAASVEIGFIPSEARDNGLQVLFDQEVYTVKITDKMREQYRNKGFKLFTPAIGAGYLMDQALRAEIESRRKAMLED